MTIKTPDTNRDTIEVSTHNQPVLLRCKQVEQFTGLKRGAIYARIRDGLFPPPCKIGKRASAWPQHEVVYINLAIIAGRSDDRIKSLVRSLVEQRKAGGGE